ncbi:MAG TPA: lipopolysaccharide transport periplasmic protein LptA [Steroidobacteraceae bacterium]|nr:lipopolysaccharide transport periplasmic protein LptA [Steroidobacteraceae bacterium]
MPRNVCSSLLAAGVALLAIETAMGAGHPPRISMQHGPISLDADSGDINYRTHEATLKKVEISQGDLRVTADRADVSGIDSDDSRWIFTGNVHITSEQLGMLQSDKATVQFHDNRLDTALVSGNPAEFEQTSSKSGVLARGHADSIEYTASMDTVRLTGSARLQYGETTTTAPVVVYNLRERKLQFAGAASGSRVHIIATPRKSATPPAAPQNPGRARRPAPTGAGASGPQ